MAFVHGKEATLSIDGTSVTAYTDNVSFDRDVDLAETTVFGNDDKTWIAGLLGATITCSGHFDATGHGVLWGCFDGASVAFSYSPDGGSTTIAGNALIQSYSTAPSVGDKVPWSATLVVTGALS